MGNVLANGKKRSAAETIGYLLLTRRAVPFWISLSAPSTQHGYPRQEPTHGRTYLLCCPSLSAAPAMSLTQLYCNLSRQTLMGATDQADQPCCPYRHQYHGVQADRVRQQGTISLCITTVALEPKTILRSTKKPTFPTSTHSVPLSLAWE
jgi:hypothetical protein